MDKKGQKFMKYTDEERTEIVNQYLSGKGSYRSIAKDVELVGKQSRE